MTEEDAKKREQRRDFQESLVREGLEIELEDKNQSFDEKTYFLKIHIPWRTESRYAEVMNLKLPVKRFVTISVKAWEDEKIIKNLTLAYRVLGFLKRNYKNFNNWTLYDAKLLESEPSFYSATAGGHPEEQFIVKDRHVQYNSALRSLLAMQILLRAKFDDSDKVGIRRLLNNGAYLAAFPLHEGRFDTSHSSGVNFDRRVSFLKNFIKINCQ